MGDSDFMRRAITLATVSVASGGGPFGAVIVKGGGVIAEGSNRVTADRDPTAHAEITAIRAASAALSSFSLGGCDIYTSCEPCPMCLAAIYWARIDRIFYGNDRVAAARIGFDDEAIYREVAMPIAQRRIPMLRLLDDEAAASFAAWQAKPDKLPY
jgi:guanine deaminase